MTQAQQTLHLKCAVSHQRLADPAKGEGCAHLACCNYAPLLEYVQSHRQCPVCDASIRLSRDRGEIVRDEALAAQLRKVPASVASVTVCGGEVDFVGVLGEAIDLTGEGEGGALEVDEEARARWAGRRARVKKEA